MDCPLVDCGAARRDCRAAIVSRYLMDETVGHCDLGEELAALDAGDRRAVADAELAVSLELRAEHGCFLVAQALADALCEGLLAGVVCDDHWIVP